MPSSSSSLLSVRRWPAPPRSSWRRIGRKPAPFSPGSSSSTPSIANVEQDVINELIRPSLDDPERHRRLLVMLRILPELERSGDLAEHIASHAAQGLARWLTPRALTLVAQMGALGLEMWEMAAAAYARSDATAADLLRVRDDEIDDLHVSLTAELAAGGVSIPVAIEMGLVARYFERLGDHAVNVTRRLEQLRSPA